MRAKATFEMRDNRLREGANLSMKLDQNICFMIFF